MTEQTLEVTVTSKAQHAVLKRFVKECGSLRAAAAEIGVSGATLSNWMNFKSVPGTRSTTRTKTALLKLCEMTGSSVRGLFPFTHKQIACLEEPREQTHQLTTTQLTSNVETKHLTYQPDEVTDLPELSAKATKALSYRERTILEMRFGLNGSSPQTLAEVGKFFKVVRERVRIIEQRALRKLQSAAVQSGLADFEDVSGGSCRWCKKAFTNCHAATMHEDECDKKP